ncbi:MAG: FG-GAP-like repeat-containing protein [Bacteroidetes bacterium]|nr:FG-GAP-like repeat-containing protein [Bacteroidota bacterium]
MKKYLIIIKFLLIGSSTFSQLQATSWTFNTPLSGNIIYEARDYIEFDPGSSYTAAQDQALIARINPYLIFPPDCCSHGGPNPGDDGVVGTLNGSLSVSLSGAATYNLPISLPPGVNGMQPNLSLQYNSQSGNSMLGIGFSLGGISTISRTTTDFYRDGNGVGVHGVHFNQYDQFILDGQRLIDIYLTGYGADNTEYRTEIESFAKIISHGTAGNGPQWFEVWTKDGKRMEFGSTENSRIIASGGLDVLYWLISKISDRQGNFISYEYDELVDMTYRPKRITYTANTSINPPVTPFYSIEFGYDEHRPDPFTQYIAGSEININHRLSTINIKYIPTDEIYLQYILTYTNDNNTTIDNIFKLYSHLTKIEVNDGSGQHLNPIVINWGNPAFSYNDHYNVLGAGSYDVKTGDFNGDGKTDIIKLFTYHSNEYGRDLFSHWELYLANSSGTGFDYFPNAGGILGEGCMGIYIGDFNGDGMADLMQYYCTWWDYHPSSSLNIALSQSDNSGFIGLSDWYGITGFQLNQDDILTDVQTGDFNGDGLDDVAVRFNNKDENGEFDDDYNCKILLSVLNTNGNPLNNVNFAEVSIIGSINKFIVGNFYDKSRKDILILKGESFSAIYYWENATGGFIQSTPTFGYPTKYHILYTGDFNGDGITDILTCAPPPNYNYLWELAEFKGKDQTFPTVPVPFLSNINPLAREAQWTVFTSDFNGDGKSDIMTVDSDTHQVKIYFSKGKGEFILPPETINLDVDFVSLPHFSSSDFNGDGKSDILYTKNILEDRILLLIHIHDNTDLVSTIMDGFGKTSKIDYKPLPSNEVNIYGGYHSTYTQTQFKVRDFEGPLYVVYETAIHNDVDWLPTFYYYEGAKFVRLNSTFLGFTKIHTSEDFTNIKITNTFDYQVSYTDGSYSASFYYPHLIKSEKYYNQNITSSTENTFKAYQYFQEPPNSSGIKSKQFFPYLTKTNSKIWDLDGLAFLKSTRTTTEYSDPYYGNPSHINTLNDPQILEVSSGDDLFAFQESNCYAYYPVDETNWILNNLMSFTRTTSSFGGTQQHVNTYYYYLSSDPHNRSQLLSKEISEPGSDPMSTTTDFDYYPNGNIKSKLISAPNSNPPLSNRLTKFEYDPTYSGRFLTKITDALNHVTTSTYNPRTGFKITSTDVNNHSDVYSSDIFGTNVQSEAPDGTKSVKLLRWKNQPPILYYSWEQTSGSNEIITYYDRFGRELQKVTQGFDGNPVYIDHQYDGIGRLIKTSLPYSSGTPMFIQNTYNTLLPRIDYVLNPNNSHVWYTYNGLETSTKNEAGQISTKRLNAIGLVDEYTDPKNTVKYNYSYDNNDFITNYYIDGHTETSSTIRTDKFGHRIKLIDPSFGTVDETYNAFGELISHKNRKQDDQNKTLYNYDALGRLVRRKEDQTITTWSYDTKPHGIGMLDNVSNTNNSIEYYYDELSRIKKSSETIIGESDIFSYEYKYDPFSKVQEEKFPSGISIRNHYTTNGFLKKICKTDKDEPTLWETLLQNAKDQVLFARIGDNIYSTYDYYPETGNLKSISSSSNNQNIQDFEYQWSTIDNLNSRKKWIDQNHNSFLEETFDYDNLNRLTTVSLNSQLTQTYDYDNLGNFLNKPPLTNISYGEQNSGPYAITSGNFTSDEISSTHQDLTFTIFDKINTLSEGLSNLTMTYGVDHDRIKQIIVKEGSLYSKKIYIGGECEKITDEQGERFLNYIHGPCGLFAILLKQNEKEQINYILKDHLGSINCITDQSGNLMEELSFDVWGRRRNPNDWTYNSVPTTFLFDRGFTGHEHLDLFGLINMNGRVYDPVIGRFLSSDNFVQDVYSQNLNRYSYCSNNPLKFYDPGGEWYNLLIGAIIGGFSGYIAGESAGAKGLKLVEYIAVGALAGTLTSGISSGISSALTVEGSFGYGFIGSSTVTYSTGFLSGALSGAASGAAGGLVQGVGMGLIRNEESTNLILGTLQSTFFGSLAGGLIGGISGGIEARTENKNFLTGMDEQIIGNDKQATPSRNFLKNIQSTSVKHQYGYQMPNSSEKPTVITIQKPKTMSKILDVRGLSECSDPWETLKSSMTKNSISIYFPEGTQAGCYIYVEGIRTTSLAGQTNLFGVSNNYSEGPFFWYLAPK